MDRTIVGVGPARSGLGALLALALLGASAGVAEARPVGAPPMGAKASKASKAKEHASVDLRAAGVFTMTNGRMGNEVIAFARGADGRLSKVGTYDTGGTGSGSFEDTAASLVLGTAAGEAAPNNLIEEGRLLFVTNARSNTISVFEVRRDRLRLVETQPSGGEKPVSVTVNRGVLYVLHSGETTDDLFDSEGGVIANCTTGTPSITGFRVTDDGQLSPIADSTRRLSGLGASGCAQISFNPGGDVLVAVERLAKDEGMPGPDGDEGVINTFTRNGDGTLSEARVTEATGEGPFGFSFSKAGDLFTTEQFDGIAGPTRGAAASYTVGADGSLTPTGPSVGNGGTDTCWFVVSDDGRHGYTTSFFGDGRISVYRIGTGGTLELQQSDAASNVNLGASDISLSRDSRYLYQLNSLEGTVGTYRVNSNGSLSFVQKVRAQGPSAMGAGIGLAAS